MWGKLKAAVKSAWEKVKKVFTPKPAPPPPPPSPAVALREERERKRREALEQARRTAERLRLKAAGVGAAATGASVRRAAQLGRASPPIKEVAVSPERIAATYGTDRETAEKLYRAVSPLVQTGGKVLRPLWRALEWYEEKVPGRIARATGLEGGVRRLVDKLRVFQGLSPQTRQAIADIISHTITDPTTYIGGLVKNVTKLAKLRGALSAAEKAAEALSRTERSIGVAGDILRRGKVAQKAATGRIASATKEATKVQRELAKETRNMRRLRETLNRAYAKLPQAEQRAAKAAREAHLAHWRHVVGIGTPEAVARRAQQAEKAAQALADLRRTVAETARSLGESGRRVRELRSVAQALEKAKATESARLARLAQTVERAQSRKQALEEAVKPLREQASQIKALRRRLVLAERGEPAIKVGFYKWERPVVGLGGVAERLGRLSYALKQRAPRAYGKLVRAVRYGKPAVYAGEAYEEHMARGAAMRELHQRLAEAGARARIEGAEATARKWAEAQVPKQYREAAGPFREIGDLPPNLTPEERAFVEKAADVYGKSMDEIEAVLRQNFGENAMGHVDQYVSHVFLNKGKDFTDPSVVASAADVAKIREAAKRMPGAKPYFTRVRTADIDIKTAEELGLKPIKDVALLDVMYRWTAQLALEEKKVTDWLESLGYISSKAVSGWEDGGKIAPWLRDKSIHPDAARMLQQGRNALVATDEAVQAALRIYDKMLGTFKGMVTSVRPAFHAKNLIGNIFLARFGGVPYSRMPELYTRAASNILRKSDLYEEFRRVGLEGQGIFRDVMVPEALRRRAEDILNAAIGGPKKKITFLANPLRAGRATGEFVDTWSRFAVYLHFRSKGLDPRQAAMRVRESLLDYSMLTPFEKTFVRRALPFYAWMRLSIPQVIAGAVREPGTITTFARLREKMAEKEGIDVKDLPWWMAGALVIDVDDQNRIVVLDVSPPGAEVLTTLGRSDLAEGVAGELASALTPVAKAGYVLVYGREPETGRQIVQDKYYGPPKWLQKLGAAASYMFLPRTDIEKMRLSEIHPKLKVVEQILGLRPSEEPTTYERYYPGVLGFLTAPLSVYDRPLAEAKQTERASAELDRLLREMYKATGKLPSDLPPEVVQKIQEKPEEVAGRVFEEVEQEARTQTAVERAGQAWQEVLRSPTKQRVLLEMVKNARDAAGARDRILTRYSGLFLLPEEDFKKLVGWLYSPRNVYKVWVKYGRRPSAEDMLENMEWLASGGEPEAKPLRPEERARLEGAFDVPGRQPAQSASRAVETLKSMGLDRALPGTGRAFSDVVAEAIRVTGVGEDWVPYLWWLAARESSFNPSAVNPQPVGREHATGLMQTLPSTFRRYAAPGMENITDPLHNMVAAIRYIRARYGHPSRIPNIMQWRAFKGY